MTDGWRWASLFFWEILQVFQSRPSWVHKSIFWGRSSYLKRFSLWKNAEGCKPCVCFLGDVCLFGHITKPFWDYLGLRLSLGVLKHPSDVCSMIYMRLFVFVVYWHSRRLFRVGCWYSRYFFSKAACQTMDYPWVQAFLQHFLAEALHFIDTITIAHVHCAVSRPKPLKYFWITHKWYVFEWKVKQQDMQWHSCIQCRLHIVHEWS